MCAELINQHYSNYTLLDIGCRTMALKPLLNDCREYYGTDLTPNKGVYECNLEEGLPQFEDNSFDIVTALDVLEHLENAHHTFQETLRVAKKAIIVSLPNMYYIKFRLNFLLGNGLSGKYIFPPNPILDRHRWVLSYSESLNFIHTNSGTNKVQSQIITPERGRTRLVSEPIETTLANIWPDLFAYASLFMITKETN